MSKPSLAILDDYQNIAPAHFARLASRVDIAYFPETLDPRIPSQHDALIARLKPFDIILAMRERTPFSAATLAALPNLKLLLTTGTRNLALDTAYCAEHHIPVAGTAGRPTGIHSTVQHTWALILGLARHIARDDAALKRGDPMWQGSLGMTLAGKTLGLVGLGKLGGQVGRIAVQAFGMEVTAWSANLTQAKADDAAAALGLPAGSFRVPASKEEFFRGADIVSLHNVLSERSRGIVGAAELRAMKPGALLVNTSRGPLIDEQALLETLNAGAIRGAALDVFDPEPLPRDSPWRTTAWGRDGRSEVLLTPHMGYGDEQIHGWLSSSQPQPTHPDTLLVVRSPKAFGSHAESLVSLPAGAVFAKITSATPAKKAYTSVQTGRDTHIELNSDLVFCNHSCAPTLDFDMHKMEVRVVQNRDLRKGDHLTFFYPSSEWEMDQPFQCNCGAEACKGVIDGAKSMKTEDLSGYWLNPHIEEMLKERSA
ncbi:hypothetical protein BDV59DRAFT_211962 [Aspergillus ambiguus]|uniref:uncharacterized protein n=1 Tax=Aspergillus ambiguus TaxID=176160 RepID=UPI003CCE373C